MASRKSNPTPDGQGVSLSILAEIVNGLATDLTELRAGRITIAKAMASANLAKQAFNGVRLAIVTQRLIEDHARQIPGPRK